MSLYLQHEEPSLRWYVWKMEESYEELCALLPSHKVREAENRFSAFHRRREWLSVRALLAACAGRGVDIAYLPSGRPRLTGAPSFFPPEVSFLSISHTRGYVALSLSSEEVGIDIEQYGPRVHKVASRFMRADEAAGTWQGDDTWGLLLHWSAKEAMFKCLDEQEVDFRECLRIFPFQVEKEGSFRACEYKTGARHGFQVNYRLHPDFVLTVARFLSEV